MKHRSIILVAGVMLSTVSSLSIAAGDVAVGKTKSSQCAVCHGPDGKGLGKTPPLVGLNKDVFAARITEFKTGKRKNAMMENTAKKLSDQDVADLAAFYSSL